ncbi:MAG: YncE family protein [Myxococcales bacterium]
MLAALALHALLGAPAIALPGGPPVGIDYVAYDRAQRRIWVPAGNTGNVDVVDEATGKVTAIGGFRTRPSPRPGRPPMGPSSVTVAGDAAWGQSVIVGNRGDDRLCAFDAKSLAQVRCVQLPSMPDGLTWVGATGELWATTPRTQSIAIVDGHGQVATLPVGGEPEGYAVDEAAGRFYTNLEDQDRTLAIDVRSRRILATWSPGCGQVGPRGLALDTRKHVLFVACTDGAVALDTRTGRRINRLKTGGGVDNLDYLPEQSLLYVAASQGATLTIARAASDGSLQPVATLPTAQGARNAVVDEKGTAYVPDSREGKLLVIPLPSR